MINGVPQDVWTKDKVMAFAKTYAVFWQNDFVEKAAVIAERHDAGVFVAEDIRGLLLERNSEATAQPREAKANFDTKVIAGFPGIGKSECTRRDPSILDSDSSLFSWKYNDFGTMELDEAGKPVRNPEFRRII